MDENLPHSSCSLDLGSRPPKHDERTSKPRRPPNAPDHDGGVHSPDIPAKGSGLQNFSDVQTPGGAGDGKDGGRGGYVEQGDVGPAEGGRGREGPGECQGGGDEADPEGEGEVEDGERRDEHSQDQEVEALDELVLLRRGPVESLQELRGDGR